MDLLEHAAGVWARKYVVLGVAVLVALVVFGVRSAAPEEYVAETTLQVRLPETVTSDPTSAVSFYAQGLGGLATSRSVVERALEEAGLEGLDVDDVVDQVEPALGEEPGFVTIGATAESPEDAAALSDALAGVLVEEVTDNQAEDLAGQRAAVTDAVAELGRARQEAIQRGADNFERAALDRDREALLGSLRTLAEQTPWRLAVVEPAQAPTSPEAPNPLRDALLALLVALIVTAELVVLRRAVRGSLSARDPAKDAGDVAGVPGLVVRPDDAATSLTPLLPVVGAARTVTVIQRGSRRQTRTATLLTELLAARGDEVLLLDAGDDDQPLAERLKAASEDRVTVAVTVASVDELLGLARDLDGPTVLDVDAGTTRRQLRSDVATLRGLGLDLVAVTVST